MCSGVWGSSHGVDKQTQELLTWFFGNHRPRGLFLFYIKMKSAKSQQPTSKSILSAIHGRRAIKLLGPVRVGYREFLLTWHFDADTCIFVSQIHLANKHNEKQTQLEISWTDLPSRVYVAIGIWKSLATQSVTQVEHEVAYKQDQELIAWNNEQSNIEVTICNVYDDRC